MFVGPPSRDMPGWWRALYGLGAILHLRWVQQLLQDAELDRNMRFFRGGRK